MKNQILSLLLIVILLEVCQAQTPQTIPYQAVARNVAGNLLANQNISLRFTVHDLTATGGVLYQETQSATTNKLGLFNVNVGAGSVVSGSFSGANWSNGHAKFMQVEIDPAGGTSYTDMGAAQMMSVPYALYAGSAGSVPSGNLTESTSDVLSITGGSSSVLTASGTTIQVKKATSSQDGYLASADWTTFNNKQAALTFNSPLSVSGNAVSLGYDNSTIKISGGNLYAVNTGTVTGVTASNGLTSSGGNAPNITLGGTLSSPTTITQAGNNLIHNLTGAGDFEVEENGGPALYVLGAHGAGSDGNVGIGTAVVPKGGIGNAKFGIDGANGSATGPHIQYTTSADNYPVFQQLNWAHDNVALSADAYYDGSAWRASSTSAAFQLYKINGALNFNYAAATTAGSAITLSTAMSIGSSGRVKVNDLAGTGYRPVLADASGNLYTVGGSGNKVTFSNTTTSGTSWTIPAGVSMVFVKLWGAGGGSGGAGGGIGGGGGYISGWLSIPGGTTTLTVFVGGGGGNAGTVTNNGGTAGLNGGGGSVYNGGGGGGRSTIQIGGTDYVTAGGGGGAAKNCYCRGGGAGGGGVGLNGCGQTATGAGIGGSQTAAGTSNSGGNGSGHTGGTNTNTNNSYCGGGGGGWFGGGAGGYSSGTGNDGGGGGGSSGGNSTYFTYLAGQQGDMSIIDGNIDGYTKPGGVGDIDYVAGVGIGGFTTNGNSFTNNAGNGYVVIYY